jgi:hypothetical protein
MLPTPLPRRQLLVMWMMQPQGLVTAEGRLAARACNLGMDYCRNELSSASRLLLAQREDNALLQDELDRPRSLSDEVDQLRRRHIVQQGALIDTQRSELHRAREPEAEASLALHRQPFQPALPTVNFASTPVSRPLPSQPLLAPPRSSPRWPSPSSERDIRGVQTSERTHRECHRCASSRV